LLFALYQGTTSVVPQKAQKGLGFSPCDFPMNFVKIVRRQGLKPWPFWPGAARLKSCPDTKQKATVPSGLGQLS
jgi:hypothetical protein